MITPPRDCTCSIMSSSIGEVPYDFCSACIKAACAAAAARTKGDQQVEACAAAAARTKEHQQVEPPPPAYSLPSSYTEDAEDLEEVEDRPIVKRSRITTRL